MAAFVEGSVGDRAGAVFGRQRLGGASFAGSRTVGGGDSGRARAPRIVVEHDDLFAAGPVRVAADEHPSPVAGDPRRERVRHGPR